MRFASTTFIGGLSGLVLLAGAAWSDAPRTPAAPKGEPVSLMTYGDWNLDCEEWGDACAVCTRTASGKAACSTPGIACQPGKIVCARTKAGPIRRPR